MYKYIKSYYLGYNEGIYDGIKDIMINKNKKFIFINRKYIISRLYDIGYIDGYKKIINDKKSFNLNKNIV